MVTTKDSLVKWQPTERKAIYEIPRNIFSTVAEFFTKCLKSEVNKQIRLRRSLQSDDAKTACLSSTSLTVSADDTVHSVLVSVFPPVTHDLSLPSPSDLLVQLKVTVIVFSCLFRTLSLFFYGYFPGGPWLAGTRMSPFWVLLELRVMEAVVTTEL